MQVNYESLSSRWGTNSGLSALEALNRLRMVFINWRSADRPARKSSVGCTLSDEGLRICLFFSKVHGRVLRDGLSQLFDQSDAALSRPLNLAISKVEKIIDEQIENAKIAA